MTGKYKTWLDPSDPSVNYNSALSKRHHDTGNWLLGHSLYENWKTMSNSFLWLHGLCECSLCDLQAVVNTLCSRIWQDNSLVSSLFPILDMFKYIVQKLYNG